MSNQYTRIFLLTLGFLCVTAFNFPVAGTGVWIDLYTQYSPPWGGHGLLMASDAFPPHGVVELRTNISFQGDGVLGKPVSYTIKAPNGETYFATSLTQADGIAVFEYSLPGSEDYFGQWTVKASVDLAGTIVCDTLHFLMDWLVEVVEVKTCEPIVHKGETMGVNVTLARICMHDPRDIMDMLLKDSSGNMVADNDLLLRISVSDELNQPVETSELDISMITDLDIYDLDEFVTTIGEQWMNHADIILTQYSELAYVVMDRIPVSPCSFSGKATICANLLTDRIGIAYCPESSGYVWITSPTDLEFVAKVTQAFGAEYDETDGIHWHDPPCEYCPHDPILDLNGDYTIDIFDVVLFAQNFGGT